MESKTRCFGGSGFLTLLWHNSVTPTRLAFLQNHPDDYRVSFYEIWNTPVWHNLPSGDLIQVFHEGLKSARISLRHLIKSPSGVIRARILDTSDLLMVPDPLWDEVVNVHGRTISKRLVMATSEGKPITAPRLTHVLL